MRNGEEVSQYRNAPFSDFDLTAIGIVLVVVMVVLGFRALARRRKGRSSNVRKSGYGFPSDIAPNQEDESRSDST